MRRDFEIRCSTSDSRLVFSGEVPRGVSGYDGCTYEVALESPPVSASVAVYDIQPHRSGKRIICGHTSQKSGVVRDFGFAVCIDTHACGGKWLTCLDAATNCYWQANESGSIQTGKLKDV